MSARESALESSHLHLDTSVRLCEVIVCTFVLCVCAYVCVCVAMFFAGEATLF